ncbi:MAG TPA: hypothetical protein VN832_14765 [Stellaceae bacterium]|nr:hypothetical protein [Stellaceae bacterium]
MPAIRLKHAVVAAVFLLSACSYTDSMFDSLFGTSKPATSAATPEATEPAPAVTAAPLPNAAAAPATPAPRPAFGGETGTYVGQKVQQLRGDLTQLNDSLARHRQEFQQTRQQLQQDASTYFATVGDINAKLQVGTTPGNPERVAQWNQAQATLDHMSDDIARLNSISNEAAADSSRASYLLDSTRAAFTLQGAVDQDHRNLTEVQGQINTTILRIDELLTQLSDEISRQTTYVANERSNLVTLSLAIKNGQLYGPSLASRAFAQTTIASTAPQAIAPAPRPSRTSEVSREVNRPLVVIRFDHPNVEYEQALYTAVSRALERRPSATFDLVAVAPNAGTPAQATVAANASKHDAENVMRSLTGMGLPADRISLSATTSPDIRTNEVRIYVR